MVVFVLILLYELLKKLVAVCFNLLNVLLAGNLPPLGGVCVIVEKQDTFLVVKRPGGRYVFPGGFIRWKEHPTRTAERECLEETGLRVTVNEQIGCIPNVGRGVWQMSTLTLIFLADVIDGQLRQTVEGQACWIDAAALPRHLHNYHRAVYQHYRRYREPGA